jgi:hypothetical protein
MSGDLILNYIDLNLFDYDKWIHVVCSPHLLFVVMKSKTIIWAEHAACAQNKLNAYRVLVVKHEEKRLLGRSRHRWKDNITLELK